VFQIFEKNFDNKIWDVKSDAVLKAT